MVSVGAGDGEGVRVAEGLRGGVWLGRGVFFAVLVMDGVNVSDLNSTCGWGSSRASSGLGAIAQPKRTTQDRETNRKATKHLRVLILQRTICHLLHILPCHTASR